ncbi:phosphoribosyl-AMP cyclohydrolase [Caballeronia sp. DA-9]|uniref:phosphoribosyl-AMP cyclohydrolase n=1 Tax=Caballeronia sp. DA-9 TaxID=3436237 RepID=UPI003F66243B
MGNVVKFEPRTSVEQVEEGLALAPKFDGDGLIRCITTDARSDEVLMLGYMSQESLERTIETRRAHYWSRSRQAIWSNGATSGLTQTVVEMRIDDDHDAVWIKVDVGGSGGSCHVGYRRCWVPKVLGTEGAFIAPSICRPPRYASLKAAGRSIHSSSTRCAQSHSTLTSIRGPALAELPYRSPTVIGAEFVSQAPPCAAAPSPTIAQDLRRTAAPTMTSGLHG